LPDLLHTIAASALTALDADVALLRTVLPDARTVVSAAAGPSHLHVAGPSALIRSSPRRDPRLPSGDTLVADLDDTDRLCDDALARALDFGHLGGRQLLVALLHAHGRLVGRLDVLRIEDAPFDADTRMAALPFAAYAATSRANTPWRASPRISRRFRASSGCISRSSSRPIHARSSRQSPNWSSASRRLRRRYAMLWNAERAEFIRRRSPVWSRNLSISSR
jgi:hypothetical protein